MVRTRRLCGNLASARPVPLSALLSHLVIELYLLGWGVGEGFTIAGGLSVTGWDATRNIISNIIYTIRAW